MLLIIGYSVWNKWFFGTVGPNAYCWIFVSWSQSASQRVITKFEIRLKTVSSASSVKSLYVGVSLLQYSSLLHRLTNDSSLAGSARPGLTPYFSMFVLYALKNSTVPLNLNSAAPRWPLGTGRVSCSWPAAWVTGQFSFPLGIHGSCDLLRV